jgi:hypothetical protein
VLKLPESKGCMIEKPRPGGVFCRSGFKISS